MAAPKRGPFQIEQDRAVIARLYLQGKTQAEIAGVIGVARSQIAYDLKVIQTEWREKRFRDIDQMKADQLAKIDNVETEAWAAWIRSQQDKVVSVAERTIDDGEKSKTSMRKEGQAGDPRFLERVCWAIEQRLRIFGFYAPTKIAVEDLDRLIESELARLKEHGEAEPQNDLVC
jgi:hypothetical protein